jgi:hypothetical protein
VIWLVDSGGLERKDGTKQVDHEEHAGGRFFAISGNGSEM